MDKIQNLEKQLQITIEKLNISMKWLELNQKNKSIIQTLRYKGIKRIIIYGASEFALRFLYEAIQEKFEIIGISDKKIVSGGNEYKDIPLKSIEELCNTEQFEEWIVITAMGFYEDIKRELNSKGFYNLISLKELVWDTYTY